MAPAPHGAGTHANQEPVAGVGPQRRTPLQEAAVARRGTGTTGIVSVSSMGEPTPGGFAGVARPTDGNDSRADRGHRKGSRKMSSGAAFANPSWSRCADRTGVRADHWTSGSVRVWQADRGLSGAGAVGGFEWKATPTGTHHETRELAAAF